MGRRRWPRKIDSQCRVTAHSFLKAADASATTTCTAQTDEIKERGTVKGTQEIENQGETGEEAADRERLNRRRGKRGKKEKGRG